MAIGVFWLIILGAVIAALNTLDLSNLSNPFSMMLADIIGYLPHLLAGLVLTLVAWLIATVLRAAVGKGLEMTALDDKLSAAAGMAPMSRNVGNVLFWLVMLLFLPSILGAFRLQGTLGPVQNMLDIGTRDRAQHLRGGADRFRRLRGGARAARPGRQPAGRRRRRRS